MAKAPGLEQIGRSLRKGLGTGPKLQATLPKVSAKVSSLEQLLKPANLPMGPEDVISGVRSANRRRMVGGVLGSRSPVGMPGSVSFMGRTRRISR